MSLTLPRTSRWLSFAALLAVAGGQARAYGQVDEQVEDTPAHAQAARVVANEVLLFERTQRDAIRLHYRSMFDQWLKTQCGGEPDPGILLQKVLDEQLGEIGQVLRLSDAQIKKLELAGKGDIKRFVDRFREVDQKLNEETTDSNELRFALNAVMKYSPDRASLDVFGAGSLFAKTLTSTLTPEQAARREHAQLERNRLRYRRAVGNAVATMQRNLHLSSDQTERLEHLIRAETRAPRCFGAASDRALINRQLSRLPEEKVRTIFDDAQWQTVLRWMAPYRKGMRTQNTLEQHGFVFDEDGTQPHSLPAADLIDQAKQEWRPKRVRVIDELKLNQ
jgi:hypothetical protein